MSGINYNFSCIPCELTEERQVPYVERDQQICHTCGESMTRHFPAPMVTQASYPDGMKRKGWAEMREASKLNKEAIVSKDPGHRKAIEKEIRNGLKVSITK